MNNALCGKSLENARKRTNIKTSASEARLHHKRTIRFMCNLVGLSLHDRLIRFSRFVYVGFIVLDMKKAIMYSLHNCYAVVKYGCNIRFLMSDADNTVYVNSVRKAELLCGYAKYLTLFDTLDYATDDFC